MAKNVVDIFHQLVDEWEVNPEILMIDDDQEILLAFQGCMKELGCTPFVAKSGREALKMYREKLEGNFASEGISTHPYDLVFLDIRMPGMDGDYVLREMRILWPNQPIEIVSGMDFANLATSHPSLLDYGPIAINVKPLALTTFRASLLMHNIRMKRAKYRNQDSNSPLP